MKKFKLVVIGILSFVGVISFSYGAELRIDPSTKLLGKNCIEGFNVYLDMEEGEKALAVDLLLDSNMEFINFENAGLFHSYIPPRSLGKVNHMILLNGGGENILSGGLLGTVYYKVAAQEDPYISFYIKDLGDTSDTNVSIGGIDIITAVHGGNYALNESISCEIFTGDYYDISQYDEILDEVIEYVESFGSNEKNINNGYLRILLFVGGFAIIFILLVVFVKKGKKN